MLFFAAMLQPGAVLNSTSAGLQLGTADDILPCTRFLPFSEQTNGAAAIRPTCPRTSGLSVWVSRRSLKPLSASA